MEKMLIVGGTGETGSWFARYFRDHGFDVSVWGPSGKKDVADAIGVRYALEPLDEAARSNVVMISVPIDRTAQVIAEIAPRMMPGALLMDVTSLKSEPVRAMQEHAPDGVELIGAHPMFGPTMQRLAGQTVILTPVAGRSDHWLPRIRAFFEADGARIEVIDPDTHDEIMAVVQALTHFAYISIGSTLRALNFDVDLSRKFMSPVYEIMLDFVGRILDQNPELYAMIQENPKAARVRETFIAECARLDRAATAQDVDCFKRIMHEAAEHFGTTREALRRSDRIINQRILEKEWGMKKI